MVLLVLLVLLVLVLLVLLVLLLVVLVLVLLLFISLPFPPCLASPLASPLACPLTFPHHMSSPWSNNLLRHRRRQARAQPKRVHAGRLDRVDHLFGAFLTALPLVQVERLAGVVARQWDQTAAARVRRSDSHQRSSCMCVSPLIFLLLSSLLLLSHSLSQLSSLLPSLPRWVTPSDGACM